MTRSLNKKVAQCQLDRSLVVVGGPATSYSHGAADHYRSGADHYTGPACSANVHFIVVGNITNAINKVGRPGQ